MQKLEERVIKNIFQNANSVVLLKGIHENGNQKESRLVEQNSYPHIQIGRNVSG